jgi:hypothetical protein
MLQFQSRCFGKSGRYPHGALPRSQSPSCERGGILLEMPYPAPQHLDESLMASNHRGMVKRVRGWEPVNHAREPTHLGTRHRTFGSARPNTAGGYAFAVRRELHLGPRGAAGDADTGGRIAIDCGRFPRRSLKLPRLGAGGDGSSGEQHRAEGSGQFVFIWVRCLVHRCGE